MENKKPTTNYTQEQCDIMNKHWSLFNDYWLAIIQPYVMKEPQSSVDSYFLKDKILAKTGIEVCGVCEKTRKIVILNEPV